MMISGYSEEERMNTIKGAIARYDEMIEKVNNGEIDDLVVDTNSEASNKERDNLKPCYVGLTRTSLHNRLLSHKKLMKSKDNSNPLHRHNVEAHNGEIMNYTCKIIGREKKIVRLFMREALEIERLTKQQIIRS